MRKWVKPKSGGRGVLKIEIKQGSLTCHPRCVTAGFVESIQTRTTDVSVYCMLIAVYSAETGMRAKTEKTEGQGGSVLHGIPSAFPPNPPPPTKKSHNLMCPPPPAPAAGCGYNVWKTHFKGDGSASGRLVGVRKRQT